MSIFLTSVSGQDLSGAVPSGGAIMGRVPSPPAIIPQQVTWEDFFQAVLVYTSMAGIQSSQSSMYAIDPDSEIRWPSGPAPFLLIVPRSYDMQPHDGMGRFGMLFTVNFTIFCILENILDPSYTDNNVVINNSTRLGLSTLAGNVVDTLEQAYITTPLGHFYTVELLETVRYRDMARFNQANNYVHQGIDMRCTVCQSMPQTNPATGIPDIVPPLPVVAAYTSVSGQDVSGLVPSGGAILIV